MFEIVLLDPHSTEAQACLQAYFTELQQRFEGGFNPLLGVSADPDELSPPHGYFFAARLDQQVVGCIALKVCARQVGEIKRLWVSPCARGLGIAQHLLAALEKQAGQIGINTLRLDSHRRLHEAIALYQRHGYTEIAAYNDNPYAHIWFEKRLS